MEVRAARLHNEAMSAPETAVAPTFRVNGLVFVLGLVVLGLGAGVLLYRWRAGQVASTIERDLATLPQEPEARLQRWLDDYGNVIVQQALVQLRYEAQKPWILSHTRGSERNAPAQEVWGIDLGELGDGLVRREQLAIVVELPRARLLEHGPILGDKVRNVPHFAPDAPAYDADARVRGIVEWSLAKVGRSLGRDVPGATLVVRTQGASGG
jgi:hypothetical protein